MNDLNKDIRVGSYVRSAKLLKGNTVGYVRAMVDKNTQLELNTSICSDGKPLVASGEDVRNAFERWNNLYPGFNVVCWVDFEFEVVPFSGIAGRNIFIPLDDLEELQFHSLGEI